MISLIPFFKIFRPLCCFFLAAALCFPVLTFRTAMDSGPAKDLGPDFQVSAATGQLNAEKSVDNRFFCFKETRDIPGAEWVRSHRVYASGALKLFLQQSPLNQAAHHVSGTDGVYGALAGGLTSSFKEADQAFYSLEFSAPDLRFFVPLEHPPQLR